MAKEATPAQTQIVLAVKSSAALMNGYFKYEQAKFALPDAKLSVVAYHVRGEHLPYFYDTTAGDVHVLIPESIKGDNFFIGQMVGRLFHASHNPQFFDQADVSQNRTRTRYQRIRVRRVIEQAFGLLRVQLADSKADLSDFIENPIARNVDLPYSLLDEIETRYEAQEKEYRKKEQEKKKKDDEFGLFKGKKFGKEQDFAISSEFEALKQRELRDGVSDSPQAIYNDKKRHEEFFTAQAIVTADNKNWRRTLDALLKLDPAQAARYAAEILNY